MRQSGSEVAAGEALRYLAELPWVPWAMEHNAELEWRKLDDRSVEVAARPGRPLVAPRLLSARSGCAS